MAVTLTANTLIRDALLLIGAISQGESPTAAESQDSFRRLNELVDAWQLERLTQQVVTRAVADIVASQSTYTVGTGGDFDTPRPVFVESCALLLTSTTPETEVPLSPLTEAAYQALTQKTLENTQPTAYYYDATMPTGSLFVWPVPTDAANDLVLYVSAVLAQFATPTTSYTMAPGYAKALRTNLALELAPEFGRPVTPGILQMAGDALTAVKRANMPMMDLGIDPALVPVGRDRYNIFTDF